MRTRLMIATATAAALLAGAAFAQTAPASGSNLNDQLPAGVATGNAATTAGPSGQAGSGDVTAPNGGSARGSITSSDAATVAPAAGAPAERASTTDLISNGPVPDTRANRAKYGMPMSNAGRMTKPAGN